MKKVNFLGIEVNVLDDDDIEDARCRGEESKYVLIRVADADPRDGSPALRKRRTIVYCDGCHHACWIDPLSYEPVAKLNPTLLCSHCMVKEVEQAHSDE